jgi:hypothetical protein
VFSIEYRLMKPGVKTYPGAIYDTKAAVQYSAPRRPSSMSIRNASA